MLVEAVVSGEFGIFLAGELWSIFSVKDAGNPKAGKVGFSFVDDCCC